MANYKKFLSQDTYRLRAEFQWFDSYQQQGRICNVQTNTRVCTACCLMANFAAECLSEARLAITHLRGAILGKEKTVTITIILYGQDIKRKLINHTLRAKQFLVSSFGFCIITIFENYYKEASRDTEIRDREECRQTDRKRLAQAQQDQLETRIGYHVMQVRGS